MNVGQGVQSHSCDHLRLKEQTHLASFFTSGVVQALQYYSQAAGPHAPAAKAAYTTLRSALVGNVVKQYQRTGYLWENYDDKDGSGRGSHPFTGWTALFVLA